MKWQNIVHNDLEKYSQQNSHLLENQIAEVP